MNPALQTPTLTKLAREGVILHRMYVFCYCSPTRGSLLSGRLPHHDHQLSKYLLVLFALCVYRAIDHVSGVARADLGNSQTTPVNLNMTYLPAKLKAAGYRCAPVWIVPLCLSATSVPSRPSLTLSAVAVSLSGSHYCTLHRPFDPCASTFHIGKWHEGLASPAFTPVGRGFDKSFGFLGGGENHYTQRINLGRYAPVDYWNSALNSGRGGPDHRNGTFDTYTYWEELDGMLSSHPAADPFFLYRLIHCRDCLIAFAYESWSASCYVSTPRFTIGDALTITYDSFCGST